MVGVCIGSSTAEQTNLQVFSGLSPDFISIADSFLKAGWYVKSGGRIIPTISPRGAWGRATYPGGRVIENG